MGIQLKNYSTINKNPRTVEKEVIKIFIEENVSKLERDQSIYRLNGLTYFR